jgi:type II secretory pathway component PulM
MTFDVRPIANYFGRLAPRERLLLGLAAGVLVILSVYNFVWEPLSTGGEHLARRIALRENELAEMQRQRETYLGLVRQLQANKAAISEGDPNFNLLAYLQNTIAQAVAREHIVSMNPSTKNRGADYVEQLVEIKLTQVALPQLVDLLYRVEKGEHPLRFSRLQIKKRVNDPHHFEVSATVSLLAAAGAS